MALFRRRMPWRPVYSAYRPKWKLVSLLVAVLVLYVTIRAFIFIESSLRPTIIKVAEAQARILATEAINSAIDKHIAQESRYEHLIFIHKDFQGNVIMAEVNNMEVARIQTLTTMNVQNALRIMRQEKLRIPLGQALGSEILAN